MSGVAPFLGPGGTWWKGRFLGRQIGWHWTFAVALVVAVFYAGWRGGWQWCWIGPLALSGLLGLRALVRWPLMPRVGTVSDPSARIWFLGDEAFVRLPRRAWPRLLIGAVGVLSSLTVLAVCWLCSPAAQMSIHVPWLLVESSSPPLNVIAQMALWFALAHLLPLAPFDGAWLWRGLLLPLLGVARAAWYATLLGGLWLLLLAVLSCIAGALLNTLCCLLFCWIAWRVLQEIRNGFDPVEDAPLPPTHKDPGLIGRWRIAAAQRAEARIERRHQADAATVDRLLDKVRAHGLPSLTATERATLQQISQRRRDAADLGQ